MRPLPPSSPPPVANDRNNARTTTVVRLGLILLALVGVLSIFGEPLLGLGASGASGEATSPSPPAAP